MKQVILHSLRNSHLLQIAEALRFLWSRLRTRQSKLPASAYDAYGHLDWDTYLAAGLPIAKYIARHLADCRKILEWGCGPGGVIRHLRDVLPDRELFGTDYNAESIGWCRANIPGVGFEVNDLMPPTRFADESFDCVYSVSVFTHLSMEAHFAWIAEIHRILRPGGLLICTLNGDACLGWLLEEERKRYADGDLVVRANVAEGSRCFLAYHPERFVRGLLNRFTIELHDPAPNALMAIQDVWIARKH